MAMSVRPVSAVLQKRAVAELNEDTRRTTSDVQALRKWIGQQPHLSSIKPTDQWLVAFLRGCKFSLQRSKEKLDTYYMLRSLVPELFANRDPLTPTIQAILKLGVVLPLQNTSSEDSPRGYLVRLGVYDPSQYHLQDLLKVMHIITEILLLEDDNFVIAGQDVILDLKGVTLGVIGQFTPALMKKVVACTENAMPVRQCAIRMLNTPPGFDSIYSVFRTFTSEKTKKRIHVHNMDYEAMYRDIPRSILPLEYGGDCGTVQDLTDHWKAKVESYRDWFLKEEQQMSNEKKRPGKPKTTQDLFGVEGSFRKIEFD